MEEKEPLPEEKKDAPESVCQAQEEKVSLITINQVQYSVLSEEQAREMLWQGQILQGAYVKNLSLGAIPEKAVYSQKVIVKDSFIGCLDFTGATFKQIVQLHNTVIEKDIQIDEQTTFQDSLNWTECVFQRGFLLKNSTIHAGFSFQRSHATLFFSIDKCHFFQEANLARSTFKKLSIKNSHFKGCFSLSESILEGDSLLSLTHFEQGIYAKKLQTMQRFEVLQCYFKGESSFEESNTKERVDLEKDTFCSPVKWNRSVFGNKFVVKNCTFEKFAAWSNAQFQNHASFPSTRFEGEVFFDGAVFEDLAFFKECYAYEVSMRGVVFKEAVDFEKFRVAGEWLCQGTTFEKAASFSYMESEGKGRLSFNARFCGPVDFYRSVMRGSVWFLGSHFQDASFANATFEGPVFFSFDHHTLRERNRRKKGGTRDQSLTFVAIFHGAVNFTNTLFYRKAVFENVFFEKPANFENACFAEEINFQNSHFLAGASFKGSFCSQELNFTKAVFDDYVNFDLANINRRLNLTDAAIDKGISFYHAVIDVVVVERDQIENRLVYEGLLKEQRYKRHYMRVKEEYLILKESFHQRGKFDEEDWAYYQYRVNDRKSLTEKAWRSLFGKPILAVQDDVPEEEREHDNLLIEQDEKKLKKAEKSLETLLRKKENILKEFDLEGHSKPKEHLEEQLKGIEEKILEEELSRKDQQRQLQETKAIVDMNAFRLSKLHESKEKPFTKKTALANLGKNTLWKLVDWGTGYGVRPFRIGLLSLTVILLFAFVYYSSGVSFPYPEGNTTQITQVKLAVDWVYFSAMAFAASSPEGDLFYNDVIKFAVMSEALIGLFLMALFVGCYTRKIMR